MIYRLPMTMTKPEKLCEEIVHFIIKSDHTILKDLTCGKLASMFDVNRSYLSITFKKCQGESLHDYIYRLKMVKIALLMFEKPHLEVRQIAGYFGWDRPDNFVISFKKFFGFTPGKFLKCIR
jgi:YesN/AraC family two-component response regulator